MSGVRSLGKRAARRAAAATAAPAYGRPLDPGMDRLTARLPPEASAGDRDGAARLRRPAASRPAWKGHGGVTGEASAAVQREGAAPRRGPTPMPGLFGPLNRPFADYRGRRVWVIGASTGIGAAIARDLLAGGARVALSSRNREALLKIAASHREALIAPLDITDPASVHAAAAKIAQAWGGFDLALVVAGTHVEMRAQFGRAAAVSDGRALAPTWDLARARQLLEVNLHGVLNCVDAILPVLLGQGAGGIGIVASVAGYVGLPGALVYGASKAALINFTESLYGDLRPQGIGVYLINPGFVDTPLTRRNRFRMPALMKPEDAARATLEGIAAGRFEIHYPKRFTLWLKLLRLLPYRLQLAAVRSATGG
jgi:NAD(P)-dependent dehydrogenase (short-subunit alcohol dehydrogenase family)